MAASPATVPGADPSDPSGAPLADLERAASGLVRWAESRHVRGEVERRSGTSLAASSLRLLEHLDVAGPMRVKDVAECLGIDVSTASLQLRNLRRQELVERTRDPHDGRSGVVSIAPAGRRVLERIRSARRHLLGEIVGDVPGAELAQAARVLQLVQQRMLDGMVDAGYVVGA